MLKNKQGDMTPYDMARKPGRQNPLLLPLVWGACKLMTAPGKLKINRVGMEGLKPPFLVLAEHQGFTDYYIAPLALSPHRASYVSDVEGFAAFGDTLYRQVGCIPTRRFAGDPALVRSIRQVVGKNGDSIVVFPEARHSNVGTNSKLPKAVGKLVKLLGLPVVLLKSHGSYLTCPIWDEAHSRKAPLSATLERLLLPEEAAAMTAGEITELLNERFVYDEYRWQYENRVSIPYPGRAEGLHKVLYQCPHCLSECGMESGGSSLRCTDCGRAWEMDEYGRLAATEGETVFPHIPDWYEFQRQNVEREIDSGSYRLKMEVTVEALPNAKGFVPMGMGTVEHSPIGFVLDIPSRGETFRFSSRALFSLHTEYDYRGRGDGIVLSTRDCCYYLYPRDKKISVTKLQFAAEYFHSLV
ncbi:MAG: 1-acyl-sn-glycerol-3-phosphate acyltransferase [Oscillospiraceae bacterium]